MELRDDVVVLRRPAPGDIDAIVAACNDSAIARFIPLIPTPYERADAQWWVDHADELWATGSAYPFVIADAAAGGVLGAIEVRPAEGSIGYWIAAEARGRGAATRALRLVCDWRTERPLWLVTHPDNRASQRVAEKAGFRPTGLVPHEPSFRDGTAEATRYQLD